VVVLAVVAVVVVMVAVMSADDAAGFGGKSCRLIFMSGDI